MIRKIRSRLTSVMSQPGLQTIPIHVLTNISRSKGNYAMKFGQWTEYNFGKKFLKNHTQNVVEKLFQTLFWKIKIEHISGSILWSFINFVFIVSQVEDYRNLLKLSCRPLAFTSSKAFLKSKRRSGTSISTSISAWFLK